MNVHSRLSSRPCRPRRLWSLLLLLALLAACDIDDELPECNYNARIDFYYTLNGQANALPTYIHRMTDYVFNANDTLIEIHHRERQAELPYRGLQLPPGQYTLVSWGNIKDAATVAPASIGHSRLEEMMLYMDNPATGKAAIHSNGDKLYYGRCKIEVKPQGISRAHVDVAHAHCRLGITVKWKRNAPPDTQNFYMELRNVAGAYRFAATPEAGTVRVNHRLDTEMSITRAVKGEFVTLRLADDDHPVFCLYAGGEPVIKEIDLHKYFTTMQINLDRNIRQEFDLAMEVQPDGVVIVSPARISDWQEGESIGGGGI